MSEKKSKILYRLDCHINTEDAEIAQAFIFDALPYGFEEENLSDDKVLIRIHCEFKEKLDEIHDLLKSHYSYAYFEESEIENQEWAEAWKQYFTPVKAERFLVLPSWEKGNSLDDQSLTPIYIEPKSAFGTGHHATTALCLHLIDSLKTQNKVSEDQIFLDLGCGTGILGIAAHSFGLKGLCTDIDPIAIENTKENLVLNDINNGIDLALGSIEVAKNFYKDTKYDIIIANILAEPLKFLAQDIMAELNDKSYLILSGILSSQADGICEAYKALGTPHKIEALDMPHLCPENIATDEIKPSDSWVALLFEVNK